MPEASLQSLSITAWSFAALLFRDRPFCDALAASAIRTMGDFTAEHLSKIAWAVALLDVPDHPLRHAISAASRAQITEMRSQSLANLAWAFASIKFFDRPGFAAISSAAIQQMNEFLGQEFAALAWSYALLGFANRPLRNAIAAAALPKITVLGRQSLSNLAWSCATSAFFHVPLRDALSSASIRKWREFGHVEGGCMASALWAFNNEDFFHAWSHRMDDVWEARFSGARAPGAAPGVGRPPPPPTPVPTECGVAEEVLARCGHVFVSTESPGDGATFPRAGDRVCVSYVGMLASSGVPFDAAEHFSFVVGAGAVICGWDRALPSLSLGQVSRLVVHHSQAYGGGGAPAALAVPPFANLVFRLQLLGIERAGQACIGHGFDQFMTCTAEEDGGDPARS